VHELRINGEPVGETGLNAGVAGALGVPVILVTGDDVLAAEAEAAIPGVRTVIVKRAASQMAAACLPPNLTRRLIKEAALDALRSLDGFAPKRVDTPVTIEVEFTRAVMREAASLIPGTRTAGDRTLTFEADDLLQAYACFRAMVGLAQGV